MRLSVATDLARPACSSGATPETDIAALAVWPWGKRAEERHLNVLGIAGHLPPFPPEVFCRRPLRASSRVHFGIVDTRCLHLLGGTVGGLPVSLFQLRALLIGGQDRPVSWVAEEAAAGILSL